MSQKSKVLITGASGCVGQYTTTWLLENSQAELLLWLREPSKLTAVPKQHSRIKLLVGDLRSPEVFAKELKTVTRVIHTATAWGDPDRAYQVNVVAFKALLETLNKDIIQQIIYFSTASILNKSLQPLPQAISHGTEYIQTKAQCLKELESHPLAEKIVAVFPTLVFGGRVDGTSSFPTSYLTEGLKEACKWLWLARWLRINSRFHFIHAADIAFICGHLATTTHNPNSQPGQSGLKKLVLGQPATSINKTIETLCLWRGLRKMPGIPLWGWLIKVLIKILPIEINNWDKFSIEQRHFIHEPITTPESFGGKSYAKNLEAVLTYSGLPSRIRNK